MIFLGKLFMSAVWLIFILSPVLFESPYNFLVLGFGVIMLMLHGVQLIAIAPALAQQGLLRKGDKLQLLLFGFFAMWELHKRSKAKDSN